MGQLWAFCALSGVPLFSTRSQHYEHCCLAVFLPYRGIMGVPLGFADTVSLSYIN